jgi:hypothetical protein
MWNVDCYLDIETSGLDPENNLITVLGMLISSNKGKNLVQLYDKTLTTENITYWLQGVTRIYTYYGASFDIPFVNAKYNLSIPGEDVKHIDLCDYCHNQGIYGGFKKIQEQFGIKRLLPDVDGKVAVELWQKYQQGDNDSMAMLLRYNMEDVFNLRELHRKLWEQIKKGV